MCELFAMANHVETTVSVSMQALARRGGAMGRLADGWGVGLYDGDDIRLFREARAAGDSALAGFVAG